MTLPVVVLYFSMGKVSRILCTGCYIIRSKLYLSIDALKMVYYAFFHSVMSCSLIFWGNSTKSKCVFKLQKRAIRIIMGARNNYSYREFLKS